MAIEGSPAPENPLSERIQDAQRRLADEFSAYVSPQDVERLAMESLQPFRNAPVQDFVPLFVERETRQRLLRGLSQAQAS